MSRNRVRRQAWERFLREPTPSAAGGWYLASPCSGAWLEAAAQLSGRTPLVALAVQHQAHVRDKVEPRNVTLPYHVRERFGISPDVYESGLKALEAAKLVNVDRHAGRRHRVTILGRFSKRDRNRIWRHYLDGQEVYGVDQDGNPVTTEELD